jgi:D-glycero-alpha-D-manno-heptose 1-phosphate guanylyltransferase
VECTNTKAVLLVGGLGTRLRPLLSSAPKALAPVGNRPFLELLVRQLGNQGIKNLVMCTGYLGDQIEQQFGDGSRFGVTIEYSRESSPLGTGGAVKLAERSLQGCADFLVMNGDSFLEIDFLSLLQYHRSHRATATLAVIQVDDSSRYGTVRINADDRVVEFCENTGQNSPGIINGGVYVFSTAVLERIPAGQVSLEKDVFPKLVDEGVFAAKQQGLFIDIGTPVDYARAQQLLSGPTAQGTRVQGKADTTIGKSKYVS